MKRIRLLAFGLAALLAAGCQLPESEREPGVFVLHPSTLTPDALQGSITVDIECDFHWTAELQDKSWGNIETVSVKNGEGGSFLVKTGVNTAEESRENTVIVKAGKSEKTLVIKQGGIGTFFTPRSLTLSGTQEASVLFNAPSSWTAQITEGQDWLVLKTPSGQKGSSLATLAGKDANENVGSRSGKLRITLEGHSFDIAVTQGQTDVIVLDGDTRLDFPFDAQEFSVLTKYNVEYKVEPSVSWITHVKAKAPLYENTESFAVEANTTTEARSGEIRFTGGDAQPQVITVSQEGMDPILTVTQPGFYGINGENYVLGSEGWNQSSHLLSPDKSLRYRLFNAASLSVWEMTGLQTDATNGDSANLHLALKAMNRVKTNMDYPVVLLYQTEKRLWYKASDQTFFVLSK